VRITFDAAKNERNVASRGISFDSAAAFEWDSALIVGDTRADYGERRFQSLGFIGDQLHMRVFTPRAGTVHVISLRRANKRETTRYEAQTQRGKVRP
jgi:uncharacterized protein